MFILNVHNVKTMSQLQLIKVDKSNCSARPHQIVHGKSLYHLDLPVYF